MLYELIGVVRPGRGVGEIKEIARTAGNIVLSAGGVVRGVTNWGTFLLPSPARKQGAIYHHGHYFIMRFDASARTQHSVRRTMSLDPRMIRYSVVKMGSKLDEIKDIAGKGQRTTTFSIYGALKEAFGGLHQGQAYVVQPEGKLCLDFALRFLYNYI